MEFMALSCSSEVLFVKFRWFLAISLGLIFGYIHFHAGPCCRLQISSSCRSDYLYMNSFIYSNSNQIFYEPNKHNPFSGHRACLCRVEVVILQAIQNIVFESSMASGSQFILKPAPRQEGKIIFAPLAPFDVLFFVLSEKFAPQEVPSRTPTWEPLL